MSMRGLAKRDRSRSPSPEYASKRKVGRTSGAKGRLVTARGATPIVVDLYDRPTIASLLGKADAAIHSARPGDAPSANLDSALVDAVIDAFAGTG